MYREKIKGTISKDFLNGEQRKLLSKRISGLQLTIQGTRLEIFISNLYHELEKAGITYKPKT